LPLALRYKSAAGIPKLRSFSLLWGLLSDLPMLEGVHMTTLRTLPRPSLWISIAFMNHLYNKMAMQTHRGSAVDELGQNSLSHVQNPPCGFS
jgi:hypothetical protein